MCFYAKAKFPFLPLVPSLTGNVAPLTMPETQKCSVQLAQYAVFRGHP